MTEITQKEPVAVIDIGSSAIRMVIAEIGPKQSIRYLENLQKPVPFGKDVFSNGRISLPVMRQGIDVLKNYKALIDTYGVKRMHAIATSALREAANRDTFVDQVFVRTGIDVEVIDGPEENRLDMIAVEHALAGRFDFDKKNCLIVEVGTGSTELLVTTKGEVTFTRTLSLGPIRLPEQAVAGQTDAGAMQRAIRRTVRSIGAEIRREYGIGEIDSFIALGADMRFVSRHLKDGAEESLGLLPGKEFQDFIKSLSKMPVDDIADTFGLPYAESETLYPSLLLYEAFLNETKATEILIPMVSIRDGLLIELAQMMSGNKRTDVSRQVINSAKNLGRKYHYDEPHALISAQLAVKLFDNLKEDHGLGPRERLLLEVSAILHDVGMFISPASHHKHSSYLIDAAEIFGLRKADKDIVSNVSRYHRRSAPQPSHVAYASLPRIDRAIVSKLAAILRVADALDKSHQQRIRDFTLERNDDLYTMWVSPDIGDVTLERQALAKKSGMFTDVLGAGITLRQGVPP